MIYKWDIQIRYWWFHLYMLWMCCPLHTREHMHGETVGVGATTKRFRKPRLGVVFSNALTCVHKYSMRVFLYLIHDYMLCISLTRLTFALHRPCAGANTKIDACADGKASLAWTIRWTADALPPSQSDKQNQLILHNKYTRTNNYLMPQKAGSRSLDQTVCSAALPWRVINLCTKNGHGPRISCFLGHAAQIKG